MKSNTTFIFLLLVFGVCSTIQAKGPVERIVFRGLIVDGPFAQTTLSGHCNIRFNDTHYQQTTRCVVKFEGGYKIVDPQANLQVVGSNRALRIVLGPEINTANGKGNFTISSFQVTTYFDREITLFDLPDYFLAVEASIGGVSVAGGTSTTNPDCLIWDIAGDG